jgi:hypothetical protein
VELGDSKTGIIMRWEFAMEIDVPVEDIDNLVKEWCNRIG